MFLSAASGAWPNLRHSATPSATAFASRCDAASPQPWHSTQDCCALATGSLLITSGCSALARPHACCSAAMQLQHGHASTSQTCYPPPPFCFCSMPFAIFVTPHAPFSFCREAVTASRGGKSTGWETVKEGSQMQLAGWCAVQYEWCPCH